MRTSDHALAAAFIAAILAAAGCGGQSDSDAFCDQYPDLSNRLGEISRPTGQGFADLTADLEGLDPPADIQDAHDKLLDDLDAIAEAGTITDPTAVTSLTEIQTNINDIQTYLTDRC